MRARNIKPGLFNNEILGNADPLLSILFCCLWCLADKEGRLEDRPEKIGVAAFPYRQNSYRKDIKEDELLYELQEKGFIKRYEVEGKRLIQVNEFRKHQRPHHTEKESVLPPCDSKSLILKRPKNLTVKPTLDTRSLPVVKRSDSLIPDSLIPDSLIPDSKTNATAIQKNLDRNFENFWRAYPKRPGANKTQAAKAWQARMNEGATVLEIAYGTKRYRNYCEAMKIEPQFIKQASTFLGPNKHYLDEWAAVGRKQGSQSADFISALTGRNNDDEFIDIRPDDIGEGD
ncbi:MAG: phage replication protein [Pseudomonadota bacterium]